MTLPLGLPQKLGGGNGFVSRSRVRADVKTISAPNDAISKFRLLDARRHGGGKAGHDPDLPDEVRGT